ncbi:MAG: hypothetical protein Q8P52_03065 [bacterium]|nr:hypothetical protein [bacterium]
MDPNFKPSFIPKKITSDPQKTTYRGSRISIFSLIAVVVFIVTITAAGGVFFYQKTLVKQLNEKNAELIKAKQSFETETVEELIRTSKRISAAKTLLAEHIVVHPIFELLSENTLQTVQFTNFSYSRSSSGEVNLSMNGKAKSFDSVALQSDIFGQEKNFQNPVFSGFNQDEDGNVTFSFTATVPASFVTFTSESDEEADE